MQSQARCMRWRAQACPRRTAVNTEAACRKAAWQAQTGCHAALLRAPHPPRTACAAASWPLPGSQATPVHEVTTGTQRGAAGRAPELIVFTGPDGNEMFAVPFSEIAQVKDSLVHCATAYIAQAVVETAVVGTLHPTTCILWRPLVRSIQPLAHNMGVIGTIQPLAHITGVVGTLHPTTCTLCCILWRSFVRSIQSPAYYRTRSCI